MKIMKKLTSIFALLGLILLSACAGSEASLQKYYIDSQDNKNFISVDIPASIIALKDDVPEEAREALASLKKMNVLAFRKNETNDAEYEVENKKVKEILKSNQFSELMRVKDKGRNIVIKYEGDETTESFDEVVVYASDKETGFALVRILGDDMRPEKIMKLMNSIQDVDGGSEGLKQLGDFFNVKIDKD